MKFALHWTPKVSAGLLLCVWVCVVASLLTGLVWLSMVAKVALVLFLWLALLRASHHIQILFGVVCSVAAGLALWRGSPEGLLQGLSQVQIFGGFLPSVLLLRATAQSSPQSETLHQRMTRLTPSQALHWTLMGSHGLSAVLNAGAMAVLAPVVTREATPAFRVQLALCAARGVGASIMWSPLFVAMAFTSSLVPSAPLWQLMLIGAGLGALALAWAHAIFIPDLKWSDWPLSLRALGPLVVPMSVILGAVLLLTATGFSGLQAVTLALPAICLPYLAWRGQAVARATLRATWGHFSRLSDELLIVVGAQVMGVSLATLPEVQHFAQTLLPSLVSGGMLLTLLVTVLVLLGQVGLHPMIGISLLVPLVASGPFGIAGVILVNAGVLAWGLSAALAIWTLPVAVAATTFEVPVSQLLTRRSAVWGVLVCLSGCCYLVALNAWLMP
ncbi:MAG: hypothetical protein RI949_1433 [Pseudomonadota bacterium]|jgi:hypothetical protein